MGGLAKQLQHVERWTLILSAGLIAVAALTLPIHLAFSAAVGAALMCGNAWSIRKLAERTLASEERSQRPGAAILLFNVKMFALIALVIVAVRVLHLDGIGVLIGVSVFPVAVLVAAVRASLSDDEHDPNANVTGHDPGRPTRGDR